MCILSVYPSCTLLKMVGYYDLSVLSMSVMVSKKIWMGWVGGLRPIQFVLGFLDFFLTLQGSLFTRGLFSLAVL